MIQKTISKPDLTAAWLLTLTDRANVNGEGAHFENLDDMIEAVWGNLSNDTE